VTRKVNGLLGAGEGVAADVREAADRCGDGPALAEQAAAARLRQSPPATAVSHRVAPGARLPCGPAGTAPFLLMP